MPKKFLSTPTGSIQIVILRMWMALVSDIDTILTGKLLLVLLVHLANGTEQRYWQKPLGNFFKLIQNIRSESYFL